MSQLFRVLDQDSISEEEFDNLKRRVEMMSAKTFRFMKQRKESEIKGYRYIS
jgi:hypothetical protein